jgi:DNA-binding transcriptional LysR family regulator
LHPGAGSARALSVDHLRDQVDPWERFPEVFGVELPGERLVFDSYFVTVRAAEKGLGIAVGLFPTTSSAVIEGRLVTPFPFRMRPRAKFHFLCKKSDASRAVFAALADWARARFAELPALPERRGATTLLEPAVGGGMRSP